MRGLEHALQGLKISNHVFFYSYVGDGGKYNNSSNNQNIQNIPDPHQSGMRFTDQNFHGALSKKLPLDTVLDTDEPHLYYNRNSSI